MRMLGGVPQGILSYLRVAQEAAMVSKNSICPNKCRPNTAALNVKMAAIGHHECNTQIGTHM